jgi:hypothetical protein
MIFNSTMCSTSVLMSNPEASPLFTEDNAVLKQDMDLYLT